MKELEGWRTQLDALDRLSREIDKQRFDITDKVGVHKAMHGLPARDEEREKAQIQAAREHAEAIGLDPDFAEASLGIRLGFVVERHRIIAAQYAGSIAAGSQEVPPAPADLQGLNWEPYQGLHTPPRASAARAILDHQMRW